MHHVQKMRSTFINITVTGCAERAGGGGRPGLGPGPRGGLERGPSGFPVRLRGRGPRLPQRSRLPRLLSAVASPKWCDGGPHPSRWNAPFLPLLFRICPSGRGEEELTVRAKAELAHCPVLIRVSPGFSEGLNSYLSLHKPRARMRGHVRRSRMDVRPRAVASGGPPSV